MMDPYVTLGVDKSASEADIRSAYRKLAKQYHPDVNPGDKSAEEKFKDVSKAYELLSDKEKKAAFDRGEIDAEGNPANPFAGHQGGGFGGFSGGGFGGGAGGFNIDPEDLAAMFGGGGFGGGGFSGRSRGPVRGADMRAEWTVPFSLAVLGGSQEVNIDGRPIKITIPSGIESGQKMRLKGKGEPGRGAGAPAGDLILTINVTPDPRYKREGRNLRETCDVPLAIAVLGGKIEVPTPNGAVRLTVKPHTEGGTVVRIPGRGIAADKTHAAGDLLVTLQIKLGKVSPELEVLLEKEKA